MRSGRKLRLIWLPSGGHIGDAIMVTSLFVEVIAKDPDVEIRYLVRRNAAFIAELSRAYPQIRVIPVPYAPLGALGEVLPLFKNRAVVVAPPAWNVHPLVIKILALLLRWRGDTLVGFADGTRFQPWRIKISREKQKERYIDSLRRALGAAGIATAPLGAPPRLELHTSIPANFPFAEKKYIVVHPFPHMATFKTMPLRRWKDLLKWLKQNYPSYGLVITGAEVDRTQAQELAAADKNIFLAINMPLMQVAGLIQHAQLYIGVDTGPTHLAGVLGARSVVLAQQNEPAWLPAYNPAATLLWNKEECVCGKPGQKCVVEEDGKLYRRCVYFIPDEAIHVAVAAAVV